MPQASPAASRRPLIVLGSIVLAVACLYWAKAVFIPVALALLLTFLLSPVVGALQRFHIGRIPSVILVVVLASSVLGGIGWTINHQITTLADELPKYRHNIRRKIAEFRGAKRDTSLDKVQTTVKEVMGEIQKDDTPAKGASKPISVVVETPSFLSDIPSLLKSLASVGLVTVLVIFMLIERQELRDRLIRLIGYGRLATTTKALDEAGERVSRYLFTQSGLNGGFGLAVGLGLFLIGVPYAVLWGFLAAALRFIPYVGAWLAASLPALLSLAVFKGWTQPLLVIGLIVILELSIYLILEPWLYGQSAGVSTVALLVAVAFWAWLWGPIGIILATPLTVCLVVLGKYIPHMEFFSVLMGDEPAMEPDLRYYQRLLARDEDEATGIVGEYMKTHSMEEVYDGVLLPALSYAKRDRALDNLTEDGERFILQAMRETVEDVVPEAPAEQKDMAFFPRVRILGVPARDEADELALIMFRQLLDPTRCEVELATANALSSEVVSLVAQKNPALVCIGALSPGGLAQTRYLAKGLRAHCPNVKIVIGRWGLPGDRQESLDLVRSLAADHVGTTLLETRAQVMQVVQLLTPRIPASSDSGGGRSLLQASSVQGA